MLPADDPDENDTCDEHGPKYDHGEERAPERKLQKEHHYDRRAGKLDSISPISNSRPQPVLCGLRTEADQDDREDRSAEWNFASNRSYLVCDKPHDPTRDDGNQQLDQHIGRLLGPTSLAAGQRRAIYNLDGIPPSSECA